MLQMLSFPFFPRQQQPETTLQPETSYPAPPPPTSNVLLSQLNVENVNSEYDEPESDYESGIGGGSEDEIGDRRRSISVAAINAAKLRHQVQNSFFIRP
jgi:hypothetical protein